MPLRSSKAPAQRRHRSPSAPDSQAQRDQTSTPAYPITLTSLPPELHILIASHLIYPDALSLKHTNRHFNHLVDTGVRLKIDWLIQRRLLHLECPNDKRCDLGSDLKFCRGSVRLLMQRRREHVECESRPGLGCLVYGTPSCVHRRSSSRKLFVRCRHWLRAGVTLELWWLLLMLLLAVILPVFAAAWAGQAARGVDLRLPALFNGLVPSST